MLHENYLEMLRRLQRNYQLEKESITTQFLVYKRLVNAFLNSLQKEILLKELTEYMSPSGLVFQNPWMESVYLLKIVDIVLNASQHKALPKMWQDLASIVKGNPGWRQVIQDLKSCIDQEELLILFEMQNEIEQWLNVHDNPNIELEKKIKNVDTIDGMLQEVQTRTYTRICKINFDLLIVRINRSETVLNELQAFAVILKGIVSLSADDVFVIGFLERYEQLIFASDEVQLRLLAHRELAAFVRSSPLGQNDSQRYQDTIPQKNRLINTIKQVSDRLDGNNVSRDLQQLNQVFRRLQALDIPFPAIQKHGDDDDVGKSKIDIEAMCLIELTKQINYGKLYTQMATYSFISKTAFGDKVISIFVSELGDFQIPFMANVRNPWLEEAEILKFISVLTRDDCYDLSEKIEAKYKKFIHNSLVVGFAKEAVSSAEYLLYGEKIIAQLSELTYWLQQHNEMPSPTGLKSCSPRSVYQRRSSLANSLNTFKLPNSVVQSNSADALVSHRRASISGNSNSDPYPMDLSGFTSGSAESADDMETSLASRARGWSDDVEPPLVSMARRNSTATAVADVVPRRRRRSSIFSKLTSSSEKIDIEKELPSGMMNSEPTFATDTESRLQELHLNTLNKLLALNDNTARALHKSTYPLLRELCALAEKMSNDEYGLEDLKELLSAISVSQVDELYVLKQAYRESLCDDILQFLSVYNKFYVLADKISDITAAYAYFKQELFYLPKQSAVNAAPEEERTCFEECANDFEQIRELKMAGSLRVVDRDLIKSGVEVFVRFASNHRLFDIRKLIDFKINEIYHQKKKDKYAEDAKQPIIRPRI